MKSLKEFLNEAVKDSPSFRSSLDKFSADVNIIHKWLDNIIKSENRIMQLKQNQHKALEVLSNSIISSDDVLLLNSEILKGFQDSISFQKSTLGSFVKYHQSEIQVILVEFTKKHVGAIKDLQRQYEKIREKYDNSLVRFYGLNKFKESASLKEETDILNDLRKNYLKSSLDFSIKSHLFSLNFHSFIASLLYKQNIIENEFHAEIADGLKGTLPFLKECEDNISKKNSIFNELLPEIEKYKKDLETKFSEPHAHNQSIHRKEGYLFKRVQPKIGASYWQKKYFVLENGRISFNFIINSGKQKGKIGEISSLNILLCSIRLFQSEDRRFCFQILNPQRKSWILQAETNEEYLEWTNALENAKHDLSLSNEPLLISPTKDADIELEDDDGETIYELKSKFDLLPLDLVGTVNLQISGDLNVSNSPKPDDGNLKYSKEKLLKMNVVMHNLIPQMRNSECLLEVSKASWKTEHSIIGTLFITQNLICFYSNIFGHTSVLLINFDDIISIASASKEIFCRFITVDTLKQKYTFKIPFSHQKLINVLEKIWENVQKPLDQRLSPQLLLEEFEKISADTENVSPFASGTTQSPETEKLILQIDAYNLPQNINPPSEIAKCSCSRHLETPITEKTIPLSCFLLYQLFFGNESLNFWNKLDASAGSKDRTQSEWSQENPPRRHVSYIISVNNPMVRVKETNLNSSFILLESVEHISYVIEMKSQTPELPYGDCFTVVTRYCITWISKKSCKLKITSEIEWHKSCLVKGIIKTQAVNGVQEDVKHLLKQIDIELGGSKEPSNEHILRKKTTKKESHYDFNNLKISRANGLLVLACVLLILIIGNISAMIKIRGKLLGISESVLVKLNVQDHWTRIVSKEDFFQQKKEFVKKQVDLEKNARLEKVQKMRSVLIKQLEVLERIEMENLDVIYFNWIQRDKKS